MHEKSGSESESGVERYPNNVFDADCECDPDSDPDPEHLWLPFYFWSGMKIEGAAFHVECVTGPRSPRLCAKIPIDEYRHLYPHPILSDEMQLLSLRHAAVA